MSDASIPVLKLNRVNKRFGNFAAVTDVSEVFAPGELICIIGPNGAGKSTLLNMICGTLPLSEGSIEFGDIAIDGRAPEQIAKLGIARKFQVPSVFESLTVADNLRLSMPRGADSRRLEALLAKVHLLGDRDVAAGNLPHGKKQWLEIGMALAMEPKVLLLDEPTAGLSVDETRDTARFLKDLVGRVTVIVIEHDMAFVRELGARTIVMHHGAVIASGPFDLIESNETVRDVYLGRR
ncbi:ATP-binding cassette domain-containing protein [Mesorhizobium sp. LjRoot246]|uniref:ATP-binding cassette domain-containing protein n=1 Tax=Mesorhizobium sp. LjRoot246 TaxID=3342294 RepID=UPI003ECC7D10